MSTYPDAQTCQEIKSRETFDRLNVLDEFRDMDLDEVSAVLDDRGVDLVVAAQNTIRDFNFATLVRNANAFGVRTVILCGLRKWDRRGAVGTHRYLTLSHSPSMSEVIADYRSRGYRIVACEYDPTRPTHDVHEYSWERKTLLLFGEEGVSIHDEILDEVDDIVSIPMVGSVRSINLRCASAIAMSAYLHRMQVK